jgi:hypothetical protein
MRDGRKTVRVSRDTIKSEELLEAHIVKGTKEEWTNGVMELYNRENGLPYQYTILSQFAAPMMALLEREEWNGIPLALSSDDSGYGKTTVVKIGINALHRSSASTVSESTFRAILGRASQMGSGPVLFDELTQQVPDPEELSGLCYAFANGRGRNGMQSDGKERTPAKPFKLGSTITANKNFMEKLAQAKVNPMATQMRIFEIPMETYNKLEAVKDTSKLHAKHFKIANHLMDNVYGVWADDYFQFIFENKTLIENKLQETSMSIVTSLGGHASRERFYAYHMACTLVAGWVAKKIGAVGFDLNEVKKWAYQHIIQMRATANKYGANTEDMFSQFLSELQGCILVTKHFDSLDTARGITEVPMLTIRGAVQARLVLGSDKERGKLYVSSKAIDDWCAKQGVTASQFKRQLTNADLLRNGGATHERNRDRKISLGRGVPSIPSGRCRCVEIEYAAAQGYIEENIKTDNVVELKPPVTNSVTNKKAFSEENAVTT